MGHVLVDEESYEVGEAEGCGDDSCSTYTERMARHVSVGDKVVQGSGLTSTK